MRATKMAGSALLVLLPLAAAAQTSNWVVRDADNKLIGQVLAPASGVAASNGSADDNAVWVAYPFSGGWLTLPLNQDAVYATKSQVPFLFETPDCSGRPLLDAPRSSSEVSATVIFDTQVFWPGADAESRVIRSKGVLVGSAAQCSNVLTEKNLCCTLAEDEGLHFVAGVSTAPVSQLSLRPPFRVEAATSADQGN